MTEKDRRVFAQAYNMLAVGKQHRMTPKEHAVEEVVYFQVLADLPLEAIRAAAQQLARQPAQPYQPRFPTTDTWRAVAIGVECARLRGVIQTSSRRLLLSQKQLASDLARIRKARLAFAAHARQLGYEALATQFEAREDLHPHLAPFAPSCAVCGDSGGIPGQPCGCVATNPVIQLRHLEAQFQPQRDGGVDRAESGWASPGRMLTSGEER